MPIRREDVEHVAELARLGLSEVDVEKYTRQLASILDYIAKLNELDTEDVPPTSHVLDIHNVFREDEVTNPPSAISIEEIAPEVSRGHFKVPKIFE
ncbi:MAG: Asp-tRNA(Asn)/Glu-tRNA(Gln) amidotransferase subunit GatC [Nitrospinota bacterium]